MNDMRWKVLRSDYLFRRPWLTARRDTVQLPDGRINDEYYVLEYPTWVNVIAVTADGFMLLTRQYRHALGTTHYELVAGVAEEGETPLEAAQRELLEETGYGGGQWQQLMRIAPNPGSLNNWSHCFVARGVVKMGEQRLDDTEDVEIYRFTPDEVKEMLDSGQFIQALMICPLMKYFYNP